MSFTAANSTSAKECRALALSTNAYSAINESLRQVYEFWVSDFSTLEFQLLEQKVAINCLANANNVARLQHVLQSEDPGREVDFPNGPSRE